MRNYDLIFATNLMVHVYRCRGDIWNVFDDVEESYKFKGLKSLEELALGTGFGLRYDQGLFSSSRYWF
jgi:hypothetical protein